MHNIIYASVTVRKQRYVNEQRCRCLLKPNSFIAFYCFFYFLIIFVRIYTVSRKKREQQYFVHNFIKHVVILASSIITDVLQNYHYNESSPHLINAATLPYKMLAIAVTSQHQNGQSSRKQI